MSKFNQDLAKGGVKYDVDKLRFDLIPPDAMATVAMIFTYGGVKYADRNWEVGMDWGRLAAAMSRHINAWERGENYDRETALPHLAHAATCALMLLALTVRGVGTDDRAVIPARAELEVGAFERAMQEAIAAVRAKRGKSNG
jgi:hypothetical protein